MKNWRLIPLIETSGVVQMAIDKWLLQQHLLGLHPPTLRFYTWQPAAISLGYHQHNFPDFWHQLTWQGLPVQLVKRPSGGRAVLHQGDLTYMIVTSGLKGSRIQVYQQICEFLIQGWRSLGIELYYGKSGRGYIHNPSCFGTATDADLVLANGVKLIGSAQLKRDNAILQHGSMRLTQNHQLFNQVFNEQIPPFNLAISESKETLINNVIEALTLAAANYFDIQLVSQPLSKKEWQSILE